MSHLEQLTIGELFGEVRALHYDRDVIGNLVETMRPGHAELYVSAAAETTIETQDVFVKAAGTTTLSPNAHNWTMPVDNRLTYGGTSPRAVHLACSLSMTVALSNKLARLTIAKNGTPHPGAEVQRFVTTGSDVGSTALHAFLSVEPGDYIETWIANGTDTTNMTLETLNLFVMSMPL